MSLTQSTFPALVVRQGTVGNVTQAIESLTLADLPPGEVVIEVAYSSLNYKDALALTGHAGVVAQFPHVPGIDCAGRVVASANDSFQPGDEVFITGYDFGSGAWGGYSRYVRVPAEWIVAKQPGLTLRETMTYGTAGFTAAQSVAALRHAGVMPDAGPVLVTGATGGVGLLAVAILGKLGYEVTAMTGKPEWGDKLKQLGATALVGRDLFADAGDRPMLKSVWAGGIDTVGGPVLTSLIRATKYRGCVTACGLVAGAELPLTVYPFLLRGVTLAGIDSAKCPHSHRMEVWNHLADEWKVELPEELITTITLDEVSERGAQMLDGKTFGRTLVVPTTQAQTTTDRPTR